MLIPILILLASFVPSVLMFFFLRKNRDDDTYRKTCGRLLWKGVFCAAGVALACAVLQIGWNLTGIGKTYPLVNRLFNAFVLAAGVEESVKFLTARGEIKKAPALSRLDVISFFAITAMGFGLIEDVVYALETNMGQILVRGVLMAHVSYGLLMGLLFSKGMEKSRRGLKVLGLLIPVIFHGLYNFSLDEGLPEVFGFIAVSIAAASAVFLIVMIFFIRKKRKDPAFTEPIGTERELIR